MSNLYIPASSISLKEKISSKIILGIQGEPGTGKSESATTFPNPIFANADGEEDLFVGRDIPQIPLYDYDWVVNYCDGKFKPTKPKAQPNRRDALINFLQEDALKLTVEQTLVLDSWTRIQTHFDQQQEIDP